MSQNLFAAPLLFDIGVKSLLLLAVTLAGAYLLRNRSAATVHRWWVLGFGGCIAIPIIALIAPSWTLPILPDTLLAVPSSVNDRPEVLASQERLGDFVTATRPPSLLHSQDRPQTPVNASVIVDAAVTAGSTTSINKPAEFSWTRTGFTVWIVGVLVCLVRKTWQHVALQRLLKRCTKIDDEAWENVADEAARSLGLHSKVSLLKLHEAQSPMTAGMLRATIVLPGDAEDWSSARRRLVLLHELAHVKRRDVLTQTAAGLVSAFYWFNPICWVGLFQMRKLRELACDDMVLSCGQQPADYADVLLDVARSYRHRNFSTAVGMAHSTNVESRILAILDKARSRVSLTRRTARLLLASATALVLLIGSARLESQAVPPPAADVAKSSPTQSKDEASRFIANKEAIDPDDDFRTMEVRILDEQGNPLEGAKLTVSVWYPEGYEGPRTPKKHTADADGIVVLRIPKRLNILRLWPSQPGYVPEFMNFAKGTHREGELIPDEFEFRLSKGHEIGGRIVNAQGNPIEGVDVRVRVDNDEPAWAVDTKPMINTWLSDSFDQPTVKTDAQGRWRLDNAPAPRSEGGDCSFLLKLSHDDYIADEKWGDAQRAQGVDAADLRNGDATIVLQRGTSISGVVTDLEGNPVVKGWVVWSDTPYFFGGTWEAAIDSEGRFSTPPLTDGEYPITIVAPGYAAQRRVVRVGSDPSELRFDLRPGKRIEIRFVDTAGKPIPRVGVYLANSSSPNTWNGSNALHNHKHSGVPEYGVPRRADENGVYIWDWAPEEPVRYSVGAKGFAPQKVSLVAKSEPHVITLAGARVVAGLVTDVTTGEPIKKFQVMPVIVFRPNHFSTRYTDTKQGLYGLYVLPLKGSSDPADRYRVRIEAEGYRTVVSEESFGPQDGRVVFNIQLKSAPARTGRIVDADGKPVSDAAVIEGTPTWAPDTSNGKPDSHEERIVRTDNDGRFVLNATTEPVRIRVMHDVGVSEKLVAPEDDSFGDLQLQPWASVSGRLVQEGQPIGDQSIYFAPLVQRGWDEARFQDSYYATTSPDGRFSFERLPPGTGSLRVSLGPWRDSPLTSGESLSLELQPGENREVVLGGDGAILTGQVVATGRDEAPLNQNWSLNYLISRDRGIEPHYPKGFPTLSFDPSDPIQLAWSLDPYFDYWVATRENHFVKLSPDGDLRVTGVTPGEYDLVIRLYEQPAGCLVETVGEKIVPVRVDRVGEIDLGRIEVPCRTGPRVGESMRMYSFTDTSGRQRTIGDMKGRYVLLHVWASWCAPCLESMPDVRATVEALADEAVTFVGLNIDKEVDRAEALVRRSGWDWSQNYLGDASDMARQLAISSAPTYFLVGPEGLLVASSNQWKEIKDVLELALEEARE